MVWKDRQSTGVLIEKGSCVPDSEGMIHGETGSGDQFDEWGKTSESGHWDALVSCTRSGNFWKKWKHLTSGHIVEWNSSI